MVKSEACEVEETQILFCYHAAEVITVETGRYTATCEQYKKNMGRKSTRCQPSANVQSVSVYSQLEMETPGQNKKKERRVHLSESEETL